MRNKINVLVGDETMSAPRKVFKSGSDGYWCGGKVTIDGERYQVSCSVTRIGSKPQPGETRTASGAILGEPTVSE